VVDVANVMGSRPDGWWRDRAGAAVRLGRQIAALQSAENQRWVLVLEGRARDAAPLLEAEENLTVVSADASGDDTIVEVVAAAAARGESCLVVTADRELRRRCEEHGASAVGPGWLLGRLLPGNISVNPPLTTAYAIDPEADAACT
jgi:hypothetical protein